MNTNTQLWHKVQLQILQEISQNEECISRVSNQFDAMITNQAQFTAPSTTIQNGNTNTGMIEDLFTSKLAEIENSIWCQLKPSLMSMIHQQVQKDLQPLQIMFAQQKSGFASKHHKTYSESNVEYDNISTEIRTNPSKASPNTIKSFRNAITSSSNLERKLKKNTTTLRTLMKALSEKLIRNAINYWKLNLDENDIQEFLSYLKIVKPLLASIHGLKIIFQNNSKLCSYGESMDNKIKNKFTHILRVASVKFMEKYFCKWILKYEDLKGGLKFKSIILNIVQKS